MTGSVNVYDKTPQEMMLLDDIDVSASVTAPIVESVSGLQAVGDGNALAAVMDDTVGYDVEDVSMAVRKV